MAKKQLLIGLGFDKDFTLSNFAITASLKDTLNAFCQFNEAKRGILHLSNKPKPGYVIVKKVARVGFSNVYVVGRGLMPTRSFTACRDTIKQIGLKKVFYFRIEMDKPLNTDK
jgi:hypothetical protein